MKPNRRLLDSLKVLNNFENEIQKVFEQLNIDPQNEDFVSLENITSIDPIEDLFLRERIIFISNQLQSIKEDIAYLNQPITLSGELFKKSDQRFYLHDFVLTAGCLVEIKDDDGEWNLTRIEHDGKDYYAVTLGKDKNLVNRLCRIRSK